MADDKMTEDLERIRERAADVRSAYALGFGGNAAARESAEDVPRLLAAVTALAVAHKPVQLYDRADGCGHREPPVPTRYSPEATAKPWHDWDESHPYGRALTQDGDDPGRICLERPLGEPKCPDCSELIQSFTGDDEAEVSASECIVRPLLEKHLPEVKETQVERP